MKIRNLIYSILGASVLLWACDEDLTNPVLEDSDLVIFKDGAGGNIKGEAWEGYEVMVGETMQVDLQVSPKDGTAVRWVLIDDSDVETELSSTLSYTFDAAAEGEQRTYFIADRGAVSDTVIFNFKAVLDGETSIIGSWKTIPLENGKQTGEFTIEFDMTAMKDNINGITGLTNKTAATGFGDLSPIIRFKVDGTFDARNGSDYDWTNVVKYIGGSTYHVRMEVNAPQMIYDAYITSPDGEEVEIAKDYGFRNQTTNLTGLALIADDWQTPEPGTHRVFNIEMTTHSQNEKPTFVPVEDVDMDEGSVRELEIKANDPLEGTLTLEAMNLPRFVTFTDLGGGNGSLTLAPYSECGGCDLGDFAIEIVATNKVASTTQTINVTVIDPFAVTLVPADIADVDVFFGAFANDPAKPFVWTGAGELLVGGGVNWEDGNDVYDMAAVIPFQIPEIAEGKEFGTASMGANLNNVVTWAWQDYDLYGIPYRSTATVVGTDYYQGAYDGDPTATALQQKWAQTGAVNTPAGAIETSADGNVALVNYLNAQLANGAVAGDYVFLRVSVSVADAPTYGRIDIDSSESGNGPVLSVTFKNK